MRTAGELSGLAVVTEAMGDQIGHVHDVLFDPITGRVTGFLVKDSNGLFAKPKLLPRLLARSLGPDALLVEAGAVLEDAPSGPSTTGTLSAHGLDDRHRARNRRRRSAGGRADERRGPASFHKPDRQPASWEAAASSHAHTGHRRGQCHNAPGLRQTRRVPASAALTTRARPPHSGARLGHP